MPDRNQELRTFPEFTRRLADTLILLSTQARNLFEVFPRLKSEIPLSGNDGNRTDDIALTDLFNHFMHN